MAIPFANKNHPAQVATIKTRVDVVDQHLVKLGSRILVVLESIAAALESLEPMGTTRVKGKPVPQDPMLPVLDAINDLRRQVSTLTREMNDIQLTRDMNDLRRKLS